MPIIPNFTAAQPVGEPSEIILADTSTGSDVAITQRRVYLRTSQGTFLVPSGTATQFIPWVYADATITIDALDKDYGLEVVVQWLNVADAVLYSSTQPLGFTSYNEDFDYGLTQQLAGNPLNINDDDFWKLKGDLRTSIDSGDQAILKASDIVSAQQCYDKATNLRVKSQYYFNINA